MDWQALGQMIGTGLGGILVGLGGVALWLRQRPVESSRQGAEIDVIQMMRDEVKRVSDRLGAMEMREGRLIRHIYHLEAVMRAAGLNPPPFNIESDTIQAGDPR